MCGGTGECVVGGGNRCVCGWEEVNSVCELGGEGYV